MDFAKTPTELTEIGNRIHDQWFDVDNIVFDERTRTLIIPFREGHRLEIGNVQTFVVNDTEKIGWYDFARFRYDPSGGLLDIETGVPLGFRAIVQGIKVRLVVPNR